MSFQRKFQIAQAVILSSPTTNRKHYSGQEFTIKRYASGYSLPYQLNNGLWVSAKELSPVEEIDENATVQLLVDSIPTEVNHKIADLNKLAFENQNFKIGDPVVIAFVATPEQAIYMGFGKKATAHTESYSSHFHEKLNARGTIKSIDAENQMYGVQYEVGRWDRYPAISVQYENIKVDPLLYAFRGSADRGVKVYKDRVVVGEQVFSFEVFDNLLKVINEHKKVPKTGHSRNVNLPHGWTGILRDNRLDVGCQSFPYRNINRLCAAIRTVRAL